MDYFNSLLTAKNPYEAKQMYNSFMSNIDSYLEEIPAWCEEDTFAKGIDFSIPQLKHTFLLASVLGTVCHNPSAQEANPYQKRQEERAWIRKRKADDIVREHQELEDILRDLFKKLDPNIIQESVYEALQGIDGNIHVDKIYFQNLSNDKTLSDAVGRLIIGKDAYVFKITKNQGRAEKEIFITTEARKIKKLQPYVPNVLINEPITNNGYSLVLYEDISKKVIPFSEEKLKTFEELGLRKHFTDPIMHRLYVLSLFHTYMKKHMNSPEVQKGKMASFNDYEFLAQRMLKQNNVFKKYKGDMVEIKKKYEECVRKLKEIDDIVTVLAHYDAKPDNFFNHIFLGDFGSVKPSNEYCDMARPFLLSPEVFRNSRTKGLTAKQYINSYIAMRKHEENFEVDSEEFYQHTLERAFVENLRIGAWEVSRGRDPTPYFKSMYNIKNLLKNNRKLWASAKINFSH